MTDPFTPGERRIIKQANTIMEGKMRTYDVVLTNPTETRAYLRNKMCHRPNEAFCALWLDNRHRVLAFEELFQGTIDGAAVYPRVVVQSALKHNAAAVIFTHNHPSGSADPSLADIDITQRLKAALATVEIKVLDHIIVGDTVVSFAERGLI